MTEVINHIWKGLLWPGPHIGVAIGIGIEFINAYSISPHTKSIPIPIPTPTPIVQIFASVDIQNW